MVGVSEEGCWKQGEWFEDIRLKDRNADVTENDVGEDCQTNGKSGSEQDLWASGPGTDLRRDGGSCEKTFAVGTSSITQEHTNLALRTDALLLVSARFTVTDLVSQRRKRETTRRTTRRVERMIPSSKHGVKSNSLSAETGPHPSRGPW